MTVYKFVRDRTLGYESYYQGLQFGDTNGVHPQSQRDIFAPWMPNRGIKIAEDGYGKKSADAGKVGHTGVIGHKDAAGVKKNLYIG